MYIVPPQNAKKKKVYKFVATDIVSNVGSLEDVSGPKLLASANILIFLRC